MPDEVKQCEAAEYGYSDCENPATRVVKIDGERVPACESCYEEMRAVRDADLARYMRR